MHELAILMRDITTGTTKGHDVINTQLKKAGLGAISSTSSRWSSSRYNTNGAWIYYGYGIANNNYFYSGNDAFAKQNALSDTKYTEGGYNTENQNSNNNYFYNGKDAFGKQNELSDTKHTEGGYNNMENQNNNNNNYFYNSKDAFGKQNELSDTKYTEGGYNSMENQNNNKYYYNNDNAANGKYFYNNNDAANNRYYKTKAVNNNYNDERQGLSDTRFMEGGKYFYDVNSEKYNHPTQYGGATRGMNSENWSNNRGYFGNNNVNSMEGYQNQEEFEDDQEDFEP